MHQIRELSQSDLPQVIAIENLAFSNPWPEEAFCDFMMGTAWVICDQEKVLGYIMCHNVLDETTIVNLAIHPCHQNQGLGTALLDYSLKELVKRSIRYFYLDVRISNTAAQNLYRKFGFKRLGLRRAYYTNPAEDALVMVKTVEGDTP